MNALNFLTRWQFWVKAIATFLLVAVIWPNVQSALLTTLTHAGLVSVAMAVSWLMVLVDLGAMLSWHMKESPLKVLGFAAWMVVIFGGVLLTCPVMGGISVLCALARMGIVVIIMEVKS